MAFPLIYIFLDADWSPLIPAAVVLVGGYYFYENFIHTSQVKEAKPVDLGGYSSPINEKYQQGPQEEIPTLKFKPKYPGGVY